MALLLVIPAVALAAILSYAVLANVGTQNQISLNAQSLAGADCLAESGINYGMYQLQQSAPASFNYTSPPVDLGNLQEAFTVSLALTSPGSANPLVYAITSTGTVTQLDTQGNAVGNAISRQVVVNVQVLLTAANSGGGGGNSGSKTKVNGGAKGTSGAKTNGTVTGGGGSSSSGSTPSQVPQSVQTMTWQQ